MTWNAYFKATAQKKKRSRQIPKKARKPGRIGPPFSSLWPRDVRGFWRKTFALLPSSCIAVDLSLNRDHSQSRSTPAGHYLLTHEDKGAFPEDAWSTGVDSLTMGDCSENNVVALKSELFTILL